MPRRGGRVRTIGTYFDFTAIRQITPAAALVLAAEYDRARMRVLVSAMVRAARLGKELDVDAYRLSLIDLNHWAPQVVHSLGQLGFFELLDIDEFVPEVPERDEHILPFVTGDNVDSEAIGELTGKLKDLLDKLAVPNEGTTVHLHGRIMDAIQNVRDHAYPSGVIWQYPPVGHWWVAASVDTSENRLDLIVYDQGVTIPGSIPRSPRRALISAALRRLVGIDETLIDPKYDGVAIKAAIEAGTTGTDQPHRGKGLMFMRELVTFCKRGEIRILSRNGSYVYGGKGMEDVKTHDMSIGGTLIEWRLYL